jgi:hypothetical protein
MALSSAATEALRLHLGCGPCTPAGWVNVDYALGARLARIAPLRPLLRAFAPHVRFPHRCTYDAHSLSVEARKDGA